MSLQERRERWRETLVHSATLDDLRRATRGNPRSSPCVTGCRSVCWKIFLLSDNTSVDAWIQTLREGRIKYAERRDRLLQFIKHPETLNELSIDPLADDKDSPWNTVREDEIIRSEIQQDVQRLPQEANYHDTKIQGLILDVLFVYCKSSSTNGGYRQGMHELLAPFLHVLEEDAIDRTAVEETNADDETMLEMLDSEYMEHDAYILLERLMTHAQAFYEVSEVQLPTSNVPAIVKPPELQSSAIVERSKFIHEVCLSKVDPELANHLMGIEILPQIFLIRWIRLLFSREFPFDDLLILWDTIFAVDPKLEMIDLICVAMLIRIRWQLLEADYSVCLQLLLKYPHPDEHSGPYTFVDDAFYLRGHLDADGGSSLITKYTGQTPAEFKSSDPSRLDTPSFSRFNSFRQRGLGIKSPLNSTSKYIQQQGGVEALFQGAAKGAKEVLERGEKLGINQAVRDAVGEIKRNMSSLNESRYISPSPRALLGGEPAGQAFTALESRNRQLAGMLNDTMESLKSLSASSLEDKAKSLELIEVAAAKIQFVKIYLEDSSMDLPIIDAAAEEALAETEKDAQDKLETATAGKKLVGSEVEEAAAKEGGSSDSSTAQEASDPLATKPTGTDDKLAISKPAPAPKLRPSAPIPTRSTLAQSSFSWMLEQPDQSSSTRSTSSSSAAAAARASKSPPTQHKKRGPNSASRERNAFLFGDAGPEEGGKSVLDSEEIFGLEPLRKGKGKGMFDGGVDE